MKDMLKKGLLASIGLASYTRQHIDEVIVELKKQGYTKKEGRKIVDRLIIEGSKTKKEILRKAESVVSQILKEHSANTAHTRNKHARGGSRKNTTSSKKKTSAAKEHKHSKNK